jgi:hypothetical protein
LRRAGAYTRQGANGVRAGGYCEERPSVISLTGKVLDKGGPLLGD